MTGLRPIHLVREVVAASRRGLTKFREAALHRRLRKSDLKGQLEINQQELVKQQRVIEKQLKKKGSPVNEASGPFITPEELLNRPKPKVVDTTALTADSEVVPRKPSLAELRGKDKKAKSNASDLTSRTWDAENYTLPGLDLLEEHDLEGRVAADPAELEEIQRTPDRNAWRNSESRSRPAISRKARRSPATRFIRRKACGWTRSSALSAIRPRHPRGADQYSRTDSGQGHGRHRDRQ